MTFRKTLPLSPEQHALAVQIAEHNRRLKNQDMKELLDEQAQKISKPTWMQWTTLLVAIVMPLAVECCK